MRTRTPIKQAPATQWRPWIPKALASIRNGNDLHANWQVPSCQLPLNVTQNYQTNRSIQVETMATCCKVLSTATQPKASQPIYEFLTVTIATARLFRLPDLSHVKDTINSFLIQTVVTNKWTLAPATEHGLAYLLDFLFAHE